MKAFWFIVLLLCSLIISNHNAAAFSTDTKSNQDNNGAPKFVDPDERMPGYVMTPYDTNLESKTLSLGQPMVTLPRPGDLDQGSKAFDQAFSHQQNKE